MSCRSKLEMSACEFVSLYASSDTTHFFYSCKETLFYYAKLTTDRTAHNTFN